MSRRKYATDAEVRMARLRPCADRRLERMADFRFLRGQELSTGQIAGRMGVTERTVERYRAADRKSGADVTRVMRMLREAGLWEDET